MHTRQKSFSKDILMLCKKNEGFYYDQKLYISTYHKHEQTLSLSLSNTHTNPKAKLYTFFYKFCLVFFTQTHKHSFPSYVHFLTLTYPTYYALPLFLMAENLKERECLPLHGILFIIRPALLLPKRSKR